MTNVSENLKKCNIAFLTFDGDEKSLGGVQRVTYTLVDGFKKRGIKSYLIYNRTFEQPANFFEDKFNYNGEESNEGLECFLKGNSICMIINNGVVTSVRTGAEIRPVLDKCGCKLVSIIHSKPDLIKVVPSISSLMYDYKYSKSKVTKIVNLVKIAAFPIYKKISDYKFITWRRSVFANSDRVVVLSKYYIDCFCNMIGVHDSKVISISNPLTFEEFCTEELYDKKRNEVLVVSRLEETIKGLSRVFRAWSILEKKHPSLNWQLSIVGSGNDTEYYHKLSENLNLKKVSFEGYQKPYEYYKRAKIFIMSSYHEGLPTTMLEAEQMGLSVVAINNFESLGDLALDGINGYLIEDSVDTLALKMESIMFNPDLCKMYGMASVRNSHMFRLDRIIDQWIQLIKELENE